MFNKSQNSPVEPGPFGGPPAPADVDPAPRPSQRRATSIIAADLKLEGSVSGGAEVQIDGAVTGDVKVEKVTIGEGGHVDGGVIAEAVEVRGRVTGSITAKQVRLLGGAHVEGDITHEQLAIEIGAFFQGRSLRLQRSATPLQITPTAKRETIDLVEERAAPAA